jgi:hypothetical protein
MFSFLNSGILAFAASAVIPLIIYLFAKRKPQKMIFSSIRFIKESQRKQKTKINLKNILLLIIRICILLFTIMAIARPTIRSKFLSNSTKHPKTAIAIIIDNSYSMDYLVDSQTELDKAKDIAEEINDIISHEDVTLLMTLDDTWNQLYGYLSYGKMDPVKIRQISITPTALSLKDVIRNAEEKLKESHLLNLEIYVLSDLQKQELPEKFSIPTFFIPSSDTTERANLSCEYAELQNDFVTRSYQKNISFRVKNHSQYAQEDIICQLFLNGRTFAEKVVQLQPKQTLTESFSVQLERSGWHDGYVLVKNERLPFDNKFYFSFYFNQDPKIGVISDEKKLPYSLASILEIIAGEKNITLIEPEKMETEEFLQFDNILIYKKNEISTKLRFLLSAWEKQGKGYLYIADKEMTSSAKSFLEAEFQLKWDTFYQESQLQKIDFTNPYHSVTKLIKAEMPGITDFWKVSSEASALLKTNQFPLALEKEKSALWLFDCGSFQNEFLLDAAFPVFAYQSLRFLSEKMMTHDYQVGDKIPVKNNLVILPDGSRMTVQQNHFIARQPGLHGIDDNGKKIAVNLNYEESNYERMESANKKNVVFTEDNWQNEILKARYGYEIWKILLLFVLLLFILEMLIVKSEERKIRK